MIPQGSRYEEAEKAFPPAHVYDVHGNPRMDDVLPNPLRFMIVNHNATYLVSTLPLPPPPEAQYTAKEWEHFPFLAFKFLEDSTQWWRIAEVNSNIWYPLDLTMGDLIRIPNG